MCGVDIDAPVLLCDVLGAEVGWGRFVATGVLGVVVAAGVEVVCGGLLVSVFWTAPPELLMTTVGEPASPTVSVCVVEPVSAVVVVAVPAVDDGDAVDPVTAGEPPATVVLAAPAASVGVESVAAGEVSDCVGVATATLGMANAVPIPSATARAPVRPMCLAYRVLGVFVDGAAMLPPCAACFGRADSLAALISCVITGLPTPVDLKSSGQLQDNVDGTEP